MAYDLLFRRQTRRDWSIRPASTLPSPELRPFAPDPLVATPAEQQVLAKLAAVKMMADAGDRRARASWKRFVKRELPATRKRAARGDAQARRLLTVVAQSGLLAGVTAMTVTGAEVSAFSPRERALLAFLRSVRDKELAGDPRAVAFGQAVGKLRFGEGEPAKL